VTFYSVTVSNFVERLQISHSVASCLAVCSYSSRYGYY